MVNKESLDIPIGSTSSPLWESGVARADFLKRRLPRPLERCKDRALLSYPGEATVASLLQAWLPGAIRPDLELGIGRLSCPVPRQRLTGS
jgi:hypothetical protein